MTGRMDTGNPYFLTWYVIYIAIIFPTVFGNGLILWCVIKFERLHCKIHILVANLAISDLIVGAILIPLDFISDMLDLKSYKYVCLTTLSLFVLSLGSSCYNLLLISVERFLAIVYPLTAHSLLSKPKFIFMIALGWTVVSINTSIAFVGIDTFNASSNVCSNTNAWPKAYQTYLDWILIFALIINFVCYSVVMLIAMKKARSTKVVGGTMHFHARAKRDLHQLITMMIILGVFIVCWTPYTILGVIVTFWDTPYYQFVKRCTLMPGFLNSSVNWIIYGYRNKEYRSAFRQTLKRLPRRVSFRRKDSL